MIGSVTVVNKYKHKADAHTIYIGRPSVLGNAFPVSMGRAECIAAYKAQFDTSMTHDSDKKRIVDALIARVLAGEHIYLSCFCAPQACHGDVIKAYIDAACN